MSEMEIISMSLQNTAKYELKHTITGMYKTIFFNDYDSLIGSYKANKQEMCSPIVENRFYFLYKEYDRSGNIYMIYVYKKQVDKIDR